MKSYGVLAIVLLAAAACTPQPSGGQDMAQSISARFDAHMAGCTERTGYDPEKAEKLAPHQLGQNERAWNACVYDGVKRYLAANSPVPQAYLALIEQHKDLTNEVEKGQITRAERRETVEAVFESIKRDEAALRESQGGTKTGTGSSAGDTVRDLQKIQRDIDQSRRSLLLNM